MTYRADELATARERKAQRFVASMLQWQRQVSDLIVVLAGTEEPEKQRDTKATPPPDSKRVDAA